MKKQIALSIDIDVWELVIKRYPQQVSGLVNDYLKSIINVADGDASAIDIEIEKIELKKELHKLNQLKSKIDDRQRKIEQYNEALEQERLRKLQEERDLAELSHKCTKCGGIISGKIFKIDDATQMCKTCFFSR